MGKHLWCPQWLALERVFEQDEAWPLQRTRELWKRSARGREDFRSDLEALRASTADAARRFAADMRVLARLTAQVPRCPFDERGATPWTSFRREVAVARSISDVAAAGEIRTAERLTTCLPRTLALLDSGRITVQRARRLVDEVGGYDDELAAQIDAQLAERVAGLPAGADRCRPGSAFPSRRRWG